MSTPDDPGGTPLLASSLSERALLVLRAAEEARALDLVVLEVGDFLPLCDYFVICHSRSPLHGEAICDKVYAAMKEAGILPHHREGTPRGEWAIVDYHDVVLHVFSQEARGFYALERLWADAPRLDWLPAPAPQSQTAED